MLAVFNLLPGYPLDGGRVLRAYLWHRNGKLEEATRIASLGGQLIAWTLCVFGAASLFQDGRSVHGLVVGGRRALSS